MTEQQKTPHDLPDVSGLSIGILGGTGDQGKGLARRFAMAGHRVTIGSRKAERAREAAEELGAGLPVSGAENAAAAGESDIVIIAVPWEGHRATLESLRAELDGKIVVDCVNPLGFEKGKGAYALDVEEGSAAEQAAAVLTGSRVVAAFHHVSAELLLDPEVDRMSWTCSCSATTARRPTSCRPWPAGSPACAACTAAGCTTPARWRRSPPTSSRSTAATRRTPGCASPTSDLRPPFGLAPGGRTGTAEREVRPDEAGGPAGAVREPVLAVVRDGRLLPFDDSACASLRHGDRLIVARSGRRARGAAADAPGEGAGGPGDGAGTGTDF